MKSLFAAVAALACIAPGIAQAQEATRLMTRHPEALEYLKGATFKPISVDALRNNPIDDSARAVAAYNVVTPHVYEVTRSNGEKALMGEAHYKSKTYEATFTYIHAKGEIHMYVEKAGDNFLKPEIVSDNIGKLREKYSIDGMSMIGDGVSYAAMRAIAKRASGTEGPAAVTPLDNKSPYHDEIVKKWKNTRVRRSWFYGSAINAFIN